MVKYEMLGLAAKYGLSYVKEGFLLLWILYGRVLRNSPVVDGKRK